MAAVAPLFAVPACGAAAPRRRGRHRRPAEALVGHQHTRGEGAARWVVVLASAVSVAAPCFPALPPDAGAVGTHFAPVREGSRGGLGGGRLVRYEDPGGRFCVGVPAGWMQLVDDADSPGFLESAGLLASFSDPDPAAGEMITVFARDGGEGRAEVDAEALLRPLLAANAPNVSVLEGPSSSTTAGRGAVEAILLTVGQAAGRFTGGVVEVLALDPARGIDFRAAVPKAAWADHRTADLLRTSRDTFVRPLSLCATSVGP